MVDLNKLTDLLNLLKKHGVTHFKSAECELQIHPVYLLPVDAGVSNLENSGSIKSVDHQSLIKSEGVPSEDTFLFWSTDYDPEAMEKSKAPSPDEAAPKASLQA